VIRAGELECGAQSNNINVPWVRKVKTKISMLWYVIHRQGDALYFSD
jgi:hypothetical protein